MSTPLRGLQWRDVPVLVTAKRSPWERVVHLCFTHPRFVVLVVIALCGAMALYVTHHFAMTTETSALLSPDLPWRVRQKAFDATFPQASPPIVVVVDGLTPELSEQAAERLASSLGAQTTMFRSVERPDGGAFWAHNRLLYGSTADVETLTTALFKAQPLLGPMATDPSLRGLADTLSMSLQGVHRDGGTPQELRTALRALTTAIRDLRVGKTSFFSWRTWLIGHAADQRELRHIILIDPVLDFSRLQPGQLPIETIRSTAKRLQLDSAHGIRVRSTGPEPLQDQQFATLVQGAALIAGFAIAAIVLMLWFAVRSPWLIASILVTTAVGLLAATALGLALFHRFNLISVAFIPLFVGMGMDLGIQFSVRYRSLRRPGAPVGSSLSAAARTLGPSLILATIAISSGFLAFAPTAYYGVSQLGIIAGLGLLTALALTLTLLPALIALTQPAGAPQRLPEGRLSRLEDSVLTHRMRIVAIAAVAALISAALLPRLHFDFNPFHLRSTKLESVSTLVDLLRDPDRSPNTLEIIRPNLAAADRLAAQLRADSMVYDARTLSRFIPTDQSEKIALIADAANLLDLTLNPPVVAPPPTDSQVVQSLGRAAAKLRQTSIADPSVRSEAVGLADELEKLARSSPTKLDQASQMLIPSFVTTLEQLRNLLHPHPISIATLPREILRQWQTADGRARVSVLPKGDPNDDAVLSRFTAAGIKIAPDAAGTAIYLHAYGRAVVDAFIEAGALSFVAICALLLIALRSVRDVAITMAPIVLTGLLTMSSCVLIGEPLNFANIIALPLLFGIGVAFHIYFVMSWRSGGSNLLTSSLTRGIFFSALATATGFGSLWASKDPGTASMGKLLTISLVWTLASALLFQPALMGRARPPAKSISAIS